MQNEISLIKRDQTGREVWHYSGHVVTATTRGVLVEALFNRADLPFHGVVFKQNDRFLELYLHNRWFNIYEIHDRDSGEIKCWYCNVTRPADVHEDFIAYDDLALDLLVYPNGRQLVLDEDEFLSLNLSKNEVDSARKGLSELQEILKNPAQFNFHEMLGRD
jgi:uncharacterized protein